MVRNARTNWHHKKKNEMPRKDQIQAVILAAGISGATAILFYRSVWGLSTFVLFVPLCVKMREKRWKTKQDENLEKEFLTAMESVSGALRAGYSLESAWQYAQVEVSRIYGTDGIFYRELQKMNQKISMREPIEKLLYDMAECCGNEDIYHFTEVLLYAKQSGGDMTEIIHRTVCHMQEKHEILLEIAANVAAKRAEQRMMMILLPLLLLFLTISSPEYMAALYGNLSGILLMSGCLAGYLAAMFWAEKITDISV